MNLIMDVTNVSHVKYLLRNSWRYASTVTIDQDLVSKFRLVRLFQTDTYITSTPRQDTLLFVVNSLDECTLIRSM